MLWGVTVLIVDRQRWQSGAMRRIAPDSEATRSDEGRSSAVDFRLWSGGGPILIVDRERWQSEAKRCNAGQNTVMRRLATRDAPAPLISDAGAVGVPV